MARARMQGATQTKLVTIRLTAEQVMAADAAAAHEMRSRSNLLARLIVDGLERYPNEVTDPGLRRASGSRKQ